MDTDDWVDESENTGAGWQAVAWTSGAALTLAVMAVMASFA